MLMFRSENPCELSGGATLPPDQSSKKKIINIKSMIMKIERTEAKLRAWN